MTPESQAAPTLTVVRGNHAGQRFALGEGTEQIGRDAHCAIRLGDEGVSRRHAVVVRTGDTVVLDDSGSTNGTWVNGQRLTAPHVLQPGDQVGIGSALLRFAGTSGAAPAPRTPKRRVNLGRIVLVGGLANLALLAGAVVIQFATDWTGIGPWLAAPLTGMVAALVQVGRETLTKKPEPDKQAGPARPAAPAEGPTGPQEPLGAPAYQRPAPAPPPAPKRRGGASVAVAIMVAIIVVGAGGALVAYGVGTVSAFVTGNQEGTDRLANGPVSAASSGVVTTIERVEQTKDFTRVELTVRNDLSRSITLPVFSNATLSAADGTTIEADPMRSSWSDDIPPGQLRRGTIIFPGHLPDPATTATFAFATVYSADFDGPDSLVVPGLDIAAVESGG